MPHSGINTNICNSYLWNPCTTKQGAQNPAQKQNYMSYQLNTTIKYNYNLKELNATITYHLQTNPMIIIIIW